MSTAQVLKDLAAKYKEQKKEAGRTLDEARAAAEARGVKAKEDVAKDLAAKRKRLEK